MECKEIMKKKKSEIANQIDTLMRVKSLGQVGLAREIDVSPSRISEWLAGKRSPSSDALWKLGKLAPFPQNLWFWEQAGLTRDAIVYATAKIVDGRRAFVGEVQAIPRFRETP
jgi:transcriptional regulator with XRE-family HTH domain